LFLEIKEVPVQLSSAPKNSTVVRSKNSVRFARAALQTAYILSEELGTSFAERLFTTPRRHPRPDRERNVLANAREGFVDVTLRAPRWHNQTIRVATWRWGLGPTVLLVHGWEGRGSQLGAFVAPLVAAGMSVVTFDAPGHGSSPDHRLYLTDLADCIADVAASIGPVSAEDASPLHGVVAHSFGAAAALMAYTRNGIRAPRNVMVAPNVLIDDAIRRFARMAGLDETDRIALEHRLATQTGLGIEALRLPELTGVRDDALLVIHDRDDREVDFEHGKQLAATWPNAQLHETFGLGHRRVLREDDVIAKVVEFVRHGVAQPSSDLVREVDRQLAVPSDLDRAIELDFALDV
jgi:alpha-beta hydrolase superfamily lysophospholipase